MTRIYTRTGDDGSTGLLFGGRVRKDSARPTAYGDVDEAQAAIGVARAHATPGDELDDLLVGIERDLWVLMAELATEPANQHKLVAGQSRTTPEMAERIEALIDEVSGCFEPPTEFVVPGGSVLAAHLDLARTVVRRAERSTLGLVEPGAPPLVYLNRLSDLLWTLARWQEGTSVPTRSIDAPTGGNP